MKDKLEEDAMGTNNWGKLNEHVKGNQVGYPEGFSKVLVIEDPKTTRFSLSLNQEVIMEGELQGPFENPLTKKPVYLCDLSQVQTEGLYQFAIQGMEGMFPVNIKPDPYKNLTIKSLRFFYLQRCGSNLPKEYAGVFSHDSCHDTPAKINGTNQYLNVNGGWHDAGDYGRYIVAAAVTVADLLLAYEANQDMSEYHLQIPESSLEIPDLLSEIRYELEWMLTMQDKTSKKVYHKVTCENFCGFIMPEEEREELVISETSVTATATFAAVMAMAVDFYLPYDPAFANQMKEASQTAYEALEAYELPGGFKNQVNIVTGEYGDPKDTDERYWAAAALYKAFGDAKYRTDFEKMASLEILHGYGWEEVGSFGNQAYLSTRKYPVSSELIQKIEEQILKKAEELEAKAQLDPYGVAFSEEDYVWGSNMYAAENGNHFYDAYMITKNQQYLDLARNQLHYLLGKNPCGYCYVTGFGYCSPKYPHHRPSSAQKQAMEGMLVGGPDFGLHDPAAVEFLQAKPAPCCFIDHEGSYSTNEVTIYWNSALIYLLAVLTK